MFFLPKIVYTTESKFNGRIDVFEHKGHHRVGVGDTTQSISPDSLHAIKGVWGKIADLVYSEAPSAKNILLLGLGGGTMAALLSKKIPSAQITAVEIDEEMVDIGRKFFDLDSIPNLNVITADAFGVAASPFNHGLSERSFDVVIVDLYHGQNFPELGNSASFFANLKKLLKIGGLVVLNRIYVEHHQAEVNEFIEKVRKSFPEVKTQVVTGRSNSDNILIYGRV